jgi:hypothetical protein
VERIESCDKQISPLFLKLLAATPQKWGGISPVHRHDEVGKQVMECLCTRHQLCPVFYDSERLDQTKNLSGYTVNCQIGISQSNPLQRSDLLPFATKGGLESGQGS